MCVSEREIYIGKKEDICARVWFLGKSGSNSNLFTAFAKIVQ